MATRDSIIAILNATRSVKMLRLEDVLYTGIIGHQVGLKLHSSPAFCYKVCVLNSVRKTLIAFSQKRSATQMRFQQKQQVAEFLVHIFHTSTRNYVN